MRGRGILGLVLILLAACASARSTSEAPDLFASPAFVAMEDAYDREIADVVRIMPDDLSLLEQGLYLREAAAPVAARHFGRDWSLVRAETARRLALVARIDLAAFADTQPRYPLRGTDRAEIADVIAASRDLRAALRFYDPQAVAPSLTWLALGIVSDADGGNFLRRLSMSQQVAPWRLRQGTWNGRTALAVLALDWIVIAPFAIDDDGMIAPDFADVAVVRRYGAPQ